MSFLWRKNKSNSLTNYGNPSPTDQDTNIDTGFAQNLKQSVVHDFIEETSLFSSLVRETLIKAFPAPDLRCKAAFTPANPCASAGGSEEAMI